MFKRVIMKLRRIKDSRYSEEPAKRIEITSEWISPCMATTQRDSIARIRRALDDLSS